MGIIYNLFIFYAALIFTILIAFWNNKKVVEKCKIISLTLLFLMMNIYFLTPYKNGYDDGYDDAIKNDRIHYDMYMTPCDTTHFKRYRFYDT